MATRIVSRQNGSFILESDCLTSGAKHPFRFNSDRQPMADSRRPKIQTPCKPPVWGLQGVR